MVGQCARCGGEVGDDGASFPRTEIAPGPRYGTYEAVVHTVVEDLEVCGRCLSDPWAGFARLLLEHPGAVALEPETGRDGCEVWCAKPRPGWWQRRLVRAREGRDTHRCPACWSKATVYWEPRARRRWWRRGSDGGAQLAVLRGRG